MANGHEIVNLIERNGVELRLKGGRLFVKWLSEGELPEGAAMFVQRFKPEIIAALKEREEAAADQERRGRQEHET